MNIQRLKAINPYRILEVVKGTQESRILSPVRPIAPILDQLFERRVPNFEVVPFHICHSIVQSSIFELYFDFFQEAVRHMNLLDGQRLESGGNVIVRTLNGAMSAMIVVSKPLLIEPSKIRSTRVSREKLNSELIRTEFPVAFLIV